MQPNLRRQTISLIIGIGIIGLGIGWLAGMSLSPVIANIITTIVTAAAAIVAAVSGLEEKEVAPAAVVGQPPDNSTAPQSGIAEVITATGRLRVNPWPLAALLVGLFFGTSAGNFAWANDIFGKQVPPETPLTPAGLQAEVEPWVTQGMSKTLVLQRLFELKYPPGGRASTLPATTGAITGLADQPSPYSTGLYALGTAEGQTQCQQIARTPNDELENLILGKQNEDGSRQPGLQNEVLQDLFSTLESPASFRDVVRILCASAQS